MTVRDLKNNISIAGSLAPAARTASVNGTAIDLRGYDAAMVRVSFGAYTDGTHTPKLQHSVDGATYTDVAVSDMDGAFVAVNSSVGANTAQDVGYLGEQRYLRVVMTVSSATSGALSSAVIVAGYPHNAPV